MKKIFIIMTLFTIVSSAYARDTISIVGSSTVFPYATIGAERFTEEGYNGATVEPTGTGGGMKLFCGGLGTKFPDITKKDMSKMIDAVLSTLFENHELLENNLSADKFNRDSWRGLSKLLSRGYSLEVDGEKNRVIGLNNEGGLSVSLEGEKSEIQSIEKLTWLF